MGQMQRALARFLKPRAVSLGVDGALRQLFVEVSMLGERLKFAVKGRPNPSSAIILAGSGRGGTTWLMNILATVRGVQPVFEPLFPLWSQEVRTLTGWDMADPCIRSAYLRPKGVYPEWYDFLSRVLAGKVRNYWTDYDRTSYFPSRFLIKEVRANLMLGYVHDAFGPSIVYLVRHPCAVVRSRLAAPKPWHADVQDILAQEELVEDCLRPWVRDIEKETTPAGAHAVWWAVENLVASRDLASCRHYLVDYESLCLEPERTVRELLAWLGVSEMPPRLQAAITSSSRMADAAVTYESTTARLSAWRRQLPGEVQRHILHWARKLGIEYYDEGILPVALQAGPLEGQSRFGG